MKRMFLCVAILTMLLAAWEVSGHSRAAEAGSVNDLFRRDNLTAWCIVPFDAKKRGPEERAEMLARLGFRHFAYDYRAEHVPTFDAEIVALKKHGIALDAWWFPRTLNNDDARRILEVCRKHDVHPQLWVTGAGTPTATPEEQQRRIDEEAGRIRPIAEAAAAQGMKVGLYNHGGWFGEPENQLALIERLQLPNVGIVYNLHHGHDQLSRFAALLPKMLPHLLSLNVNGMEPDGDKHGRKILPLGQGTLDLELLRTIRASGYRGPIGILGHTQDDAEQRLQDNLDGLDWLLPQLEGVAAGPKPQPRTLQIAAVREQPQTDRPRPVQVFILAGQSNMEGHGFIKAEPKRNGGRGSLEYASKQAATAERFKPLLEAAGKWRVRDDVWISYLQRGGPLTVGYGANEERIGPELGFGWVVGDGLDTPVLLVKCAWGGKSLAIDFRPPSSGKVPYPLNPKLQEAIAKDPTILGKYYRETVGLVQAALKELPKHVPGATADNYVLGGFGWHQGWNDRIDDKFNAEYEANMVNFIRDMRKDLNAPQLPFVIAETGMAGPNETHPRALSLMKAQAAAAARPEFAGNVAFVKTQSFWRDATESPTAQGYHWNTNAETYYLIGEAMGQAMWKLINTKSRPPANP